MRLPLIALAAALAPGLAAAASFDCAKASSAAEKAICSTPALSRADEELAAAYAAALRATPRPASLRREQAQWLKSERGAGASEMAASYPDRIKSLRDQARLDLAARQVIPVAALATRCSVPLEGRCKVASWGRLRAPSATAPGLWWQLEEDGEDYGARASVVLQGPPGAAQAGPAAWLSEIGVHYQAPTIVRSPAGPLLYLPGVMDGTGVLNADALFHETPAGWREIDSESWLDALGRRLPKGLGVWKGVFPDYGRMTASTSLWKDNDANCCPTGGRADVTLRIDGGKVILADARIVLGAKAALAD